MSLTLAEQQRAIELDAAQCMSSFHYFVTQTFPILEPGRQFIDGWHIRALCAHMEACYYGEIQNLLINIPPRHMKSLIVSVLFPAWVWIKSPDRRFLCSSYADSLSVRDSVKTRRVVQSDWYQNRFGAVFKLTGDQNQKQKFENDKTGYRLATSVGGVGTGEGGDFIMVDDPHNVKDTSSEVIRQGVLDWWDEAMSSRGNDPKTFCKIIIMQRIHEKDLSGHVIEKGNYVHLCLPARFEPSRKCITSIGWEDPRNDEGELLWPKRFTEKALTSLEIAMGSQAVAGQLQQSPSPAEGNIFKRDKWKFYKEIPHDLTKAGISADLTFKEGKKNDFVVFECWGRRGADKYLLDLVRAKMSFNSQIIAFTAFCAKWPQAHSKWIEDAANAAALIDVLRTKIPGLIPVLPRGSKIFRAEAISPQQESGNLYLPDPSIAPWVLDYIEEHAVFPNGAHDDQVDATSLGVLKISEGYIDSWAPLSITGTSKWLK
jgi:predicted phage terminase large subunit-like protein